MNRTSADLIEYLRGERGEPIMKQVAASDLARLSQLSPELWQRCTVEQWMEAIEAAIACGAIQDSPKGIFIAVKKLEPKMEQRSLF